MKDLQDLFLLQDTEKSIKQNFQANRDGLSAIKHKAANIEDHAGLNNLNLAGGVKVRDP